MGTYQEAFGNELQLKMTSIANMGFNVLLLQEVNAHWAEKARQILSRSGTWNSVVGTQSLAILAKDWVERMVVLVVRLLVGWVVGESCFRVVCYVCVYDVCVYDVCMCVCVCLFVCLCLCTVCMCVGGVCERVSGSVFHQDDLWNIEKKDMEKLVNGYDKWQMQVVLCLVVGCI